jgi:polyribonucleotide nucleotidyltransferase
MEENITIEFAGRPLTLSAGGLAKQADGSVLARYGDTVVLVTAVAEKQERDKDFLPLTVNYQEMSYAAGKFPGGFFKREDVRRRGDTHIPPHRQAPETSFPRTGDMRPGDLTVLSADRTTTLVS